MYSTGTLFFLTASTISSDSTWRTRGSFAPCNTMIGFLTRSAWNNGDIAYSRVESAEYGSPISSYNAWRNDSQNGGIDFNVRIQLVTPKILTPTLNSSGANVMAAIVM